MDITYRGYKDQQGCPKRNCTVKVMVITGAACILQFRDYSCMIAQNSWIWTMIARVLQLELKHPFAMDAHNEMEVQLSMSSTILMHDL